MLGFWLRTMGEGRKQHNFVRETVGQGTVGEKGLGQ